MSINMTIQSLLLKQNWTKAGNDYVGDSPEGAASGGDAALAWSANDGVADGNTITITTDGTYSFGTKTNAKPMYFWDAKDGLNSSSLSRRAFTLSVGSMNGSSDLTGSSDSYRVDIPTAGAITSGGPFYTDLDGAGDNAQVQQATAGSTASAEQIENVTTINEDGLDPWMWLLIGMLLPMPKFMKVIF